MSESKPGLSETEVKLLLYELCVRLGFCLPQEAQRQLEHNPPIEVEAFADAVYASEGADPAAHPYIRRQVCECIAAHFARRPVPWARISQSAISRSLRSRREAENSSAPPLE